MRSAPFFCLVLCAALILPSMPLTCNAQHVVTRPTSSQLQGIVDMNDVLEESTPSQFATQSLKNLLERSEVITPNHLREREGLGESKTSEFNKSFIQFKKTVYNSKDYPHELSQSANHIIQFLEVSNELNFDPGATNVGLRLFHNKIKMCEVVDHEMLLRLLDATPPLFERFFAPSAKDGQQEVVGLGFVKKQIEGLILSKFTNNIQFFKTEPDAFISSLAHDLTSYFNDEAAKQKSLAAKAEATERFRNTIIRFYETVLSKIMWNPQNHDVIWRSFTSIAQGLRLLGEYGVIQHMDDMDDLLWSLTHRYCYFLDLAGSALPLKFYTQMEHDLDARSVYFLEYREQDDGIKTKKESLLESITQAKARAVAYEKKGIIPSYPLFN